MFRTEVTLDHLELYTWSVTQRHISKADSTEKPLAQWGWEPYRCIRWGGGWSIVMEYLYIVLLNNPASRTVNNGTLDKGGAREPSLEWQRAGATGSDVVMSRS